MKGFGSQLGKGVDGESSRAGKRGGRTFGTAFARTGIGPIKAGFGTIGKLGAGLFAGVAVGGFFKSAISGASDLQESASKVNVVFGKQGPAILKASQTSAKAMGLSKNAYLAATGTLGNLLVSLDIAPKKAAGMSSSMVRLAGDLASFNNVSPEAALEAIRSGLTGETEPLKQFGVNMNDATLKTQAMKMGLIKNTKEALTPQSKALAAQALIMAQTGTAQGDFARTSKGLANQQRILAAQFDDTKSKIGAVLLPAMTSIVTAVNSKVLPALKGWGGKVGDFAAPLVAKAKEVAPQIGAAITSGFATVKITMTPIIAQIATGAQAAAATVITGVKTGLDTGNWAPLGASIGRALVTAIQGAGTALAAIGKVLGDMLAKVDWVGIGVKMGQQAPSLLIGLAAGLVTFDFGSLLRGLAEHWRVILVAVILTAFAPAKLLGAVGGVLARIPLAGKLLAWALEHFAGFSKGLVRMVGDAFGFVGRALLDGIRTVFPNAGRALESAALGLPLRINTAIVQLAVKGGQLVARFVGAIRARISEVGAQGALMANAVVRPFARAGTWLLSAGRDVVMGLASGIRGAASIILGAAVKFLADQIPGPLKKLLGISSPAKATMPIGRQIVEGVAVGMRNATTSALDAAKALVDRISGRLNARLSAAVDKLSALKDKAREAFSTAAGGIGSFLDISQIGQSVTDELGNVTVPSTASLFSGFAASAQAFAAALKGMADNKLPVSLISTIAGSGNLAAAQSMANLNPADTSSVITSTNAIDAAQRQGGNLLAELIVDPKLLAAVTATAAEDKKQVELLQAVVKKLDGLDKDTTVSAKISGDDLMILVHRAEKKAKGR
jgi:hypothetical protein